MDEKYMKAAIREAKKAQSIDEVPIGAVIVYNDQIIARAHNLRESKQNSTAHAEIIAINKACRKLKSWRLEDCTLYVTLEPCPMCTGAIIQSRIKRVVFGAYDPKGGCLGSCTNLMEVKGFNHYSDILGGVLIDDCAEMLKEFFREKRKNKSAKV